MPLGSPPPFRACPVLLHSAGDADRHRSGPDGRPFGIVVINVDLGAEFARIRAARRPDSQIFVVNERGDYLFHPDQSREFGFAFAKA